VQTLEKRIVALEQANTTGRITTMIIRFESPGDTDKELFKLEGSYTVTPRQRWMRMDGETEKDFTDRASEEVTRNAGIALLFQAD
jgi:hypothetical protein